MATVTQALHALGVTEWVVTGEPTDADEFGSMFRKVTGKTEDGTAILSDNATDWGVTWDEVNTKMQELTAAEPMEALREERNRKLAETDWWAVQDRTMTKDQKDYRTALRDITKDYSSLDDVKWPDVPNW